jgi:PAS domain S-box-containing protein
MAERPPWPDGAIRRALSEIGVPAGIVDKSGILRWSNERAVELFGDQRGLAFPDVVAPESRQWARLVMARLVVGGQPGVNWRATLVDRHGRKFPAEIHSVPLTDGKTLIGVFGIVHVAEAAAGAGAPQTPLTPRQLEVLHALANGASTRQIAETLGISVETVRNYVRAILGALEVHSRLEAVIAARRLGLV